MTAHLNEDTLLDLAYGELSPTDTAGAEGHIQSCPECAGGLARIRGVRRVMAGLPQEPPPSSGQESLLAYAAQTANRRSAGSSGSRWGRYFAVFGSLAALVVVGLVATPVLHQIRPEAFSPAAGGANNDNDVPAAVVVTMPAASPAGDALAEAERRAPKNSLHLRQKGLERPQKTLDEDFAAAGLKGSGSHGVGALGMAKSKLAATKEGGLAFEGNAVGGAIADPSTFQKEEAQRSRISEENSGPPPSAPATPADSERKAQVLQPSTSPASRSVLAKPVPALSPMVATAPSKAPAEQRESQADLKRSDSFALEKSATSSPTRSVMAHRRDDIPGPGQNGESNLRGAMAQTEVDRANKKDLAFDDRVERAEPSEEIKRIREQLAAAQGSQREPLLQRLCDAEFTAGLYPDAEATCSRLIREFPDSRFAATARSRVVGARRRTALDKVDAAQNAVTH